jgi:ribokinase
MPDLVTVVGSLNRDVVFEVAAPPVPGETVLATPGGHFRGGKGANQAIAAARLGRPVAMVGRIGTDAEGRAYMRALVEEGIDVAGVAVDIDAPTGTAYVLLQPGGENSIIVVPGANARLTPEDVALVADQLDSAAVTLMQLEVPLDAVRAAARLSGGMVVLNAAPGRHLGPEILSVVDVLVVNRSELAAVSGRRPASKEATLAEHARSIPGPRTVIVTLGAAGALIVTQDAYESIPAPAVDVVDTTGAGDAFCGGLADGLARGLAMVEAVAWAVAAGAAATTELGAQAGLPDSDRVASLVGG